MRCCSTLLLFLVCGISEESPTPRASLSAQERDAEERLPVGAVRRLGDVRFWWKNCYISSLIFSPDSKTLAVAAGPYQYEPLEEPALRLLEIPSGAERPRLRKLPPSMRAAAFSPDGKAFAAVHSVAGTFSFGLSVWDLTQGTRRYGFKLENEPGHALAYSPDSRCLALTQDETVSLCDAATGRELRRLEEWVPKVVALAFSPDGKLLASSQEDGVRHGGALRVWKVADGKLLREIAFSSEAPFQEFQFSRDGKLLAAWRRYGSVSLYEVATGREMLTIRGKFPTVAFSADGKLLATGGASIHLWELPSGQQLHSMPGYAGMRLLTVSPNGKMLAAINDEREGERGTRLHLWDVACVAEMVSYVGHRASVRSLSCSADGRTLISAGADGTIRLWDSVEGRQRRVLEDRKADFRSVAVSLDGRTIVAMDAGGEVTIRMAAGKERERRLTSVPRSLFDPRLVKPLLGFSADGRIAVAGRKVWKGGFDKAPHTLRADRDEGDPVALSPDGSLFASLTFSSLSMLGMGKGGSATSVLRVRRLESGEEVCRIRGESSDEFWAVAFSPDGKIVAISRIMNDQFHGHFYQHQLVFWEVASGKRLLTIDLRYLTHALAFSPDGKLAATASGLDFGSQNDRIIRIWDVTTGRLLDELPGHGGRVNALLFSPDGRRLFSAGGDGAILVWDTRWPHPRPRPSHGDLTLEQLRSAWADLAGGDAPKAFRALTALAAVPRRAVPFLREHLHMPPAPDRPLIARLIADLDSADFAVREKARTALEQQGEYAELALRETLQTRPSLEVRRRVEALLERVRQFPHGPEQLRISRAMLALEWMGSPKARQLVETLAQGPPEARLTQEAQAARQCLLRLSLSKKQGQSSTPR